MAKTPANGEGGNKAPALIDLPICGIVMPISECDGCDATHWTDVREIVKTAAGNVGFNPQLVSMADDAGIIHERIIQNLRHNPIVVCDVSGKNPNVMFELGLRLAFDKPTIVIKDDKTSYSFDTAIIEHLEYPRDLRHPKIVEFVKNLANKIHATHIKATSDPNYTAFLKHFTTKEVSEPRRSIEPTDAMLGIIGTPLVVLALAVGSCAHLAMKCFEAVRDRR